MSNVTIDVEMLGWMLIHSLWILAIINTFAWLTLRLLRQQSAQARYIVGCLAMLLSLVSLPLTLICMKVPYPETHPTIPVVSPTNGDQEPLPQRTSESVEAIESPHFVENLSIEIARPSPVPAESTPPSRINSAQLPDTTAGMQQSLSMVGYWVRPYLTWMVATWTAGVLLLSLRPLIGWWYVRRLRRAGLMSVDGAVQRAVTDLVQRLRIRQVVAVFQSALVDVPCVVGAWKPVILLPVAVLAGLTTDQLEAVLAHELAHIRRHDFVINILQTLVETLLFYHPAIWWLSSRIRQEREHCCDDIAIGLLGDVAGYATMLLSLERMRIRIVPSTVAAGGGSLVQRIRRLTNAPTVESRSPAMSLIVMTTVLAIAGSWAWGSAHTRQKEIGETNTVSSQETQDATLVDPPTGKIKVTGPAPGSWPQWGGSSLRNHVASGRLPLDWSVEKGTNLLWKTKLGTNTYSSPVIADGKVLIGTNNGSGIDPRHPKEVDMSCLVCFDQQSGQMLWQYASKKLPAGRVYDWPQIGLCSSPCVHGDRVWFISNRCEVVCLDLNGFRDRENDGPINDETASTDVDADVVWKFDMFEKLGVRPLHQSVSCITLVDGLLLMNTSNGPDESYTRVPAPDAPSFLALNASTGEVVWKHTSAPEAVAIGGSACSNVGASPAAGTINDVAQVIFTGREGWVYGFDFADLKKGQSTVLWSFDCNPKSSTYSVGGTSRRNTILSTPVIWKNRVYVATGRNPEMGEGPADLWCIDPSRRGDISSELVFNKSFENGTTPIPRKYNPACNPQAGDFVLPNPNSGAVWHLEPNDRNGDGKIDFAESFHRTIGTPAIHDGLLFIADLTGLLHCIDARAGKVHWVHDLQSSVWGSCLIADGHVLLGNEDGDLKIFKASPNMEIVKTENFGHQIYTTPVLVNETLFVASHASLLALHDPKQIAAAPQDVQEASKDTKPAVTLVLTDSQDKPVGGTVHVGSVGYSADLQKLRAWETPRQGVIELTGLAAGKHTLVADASTDSPTIFGIELPTESLPIRQRLNPRVELSSVNGVDPLEIRTKLITRSGHSVIDVEFTNKTDKPITLPLLSMVDFDLRVFIPQKLVADDTTIPPHRTRTIPLNWTRIVKEGIWTSRSLESIDEPWPAKAAGDGLRYFRLDVGRVGTLPLALPKPELVLQRTEVPTVDPEPPTQAATREFPLGNFGGVPQRGAQPAPMSPEARPTADNTTPWIDAEYFLQYRIRIANNGSGYSGKAAAPMLLLDLRNTGKLNLALEKVQTRHEVVVDQVDYFRNDQPWGGIDPVDETGFCIPFLLTSDWKSRPSKGEEGLSLNPGPHAVAIRIKLHETSRNADGQLAIEPRGGRVLTTRPFNLEFHEPETDLTKSLAVENIRRELIAFPRFFAPKVSANLQQLVRNTQPESGDFLLKSLGSGNMTAPDPASFVIAQTWENLSRAQREQYLKSSMIHFAEMRPTYPQGVDAGIAVGPRFASDYAGVPAGKLEVKSKTVTTHFLDGQQVGEPMTYPLHTAISHWFRTGSLPLGQHSIRLVTEYEFQRGDESYTGKFESERTFEIVANGPDMLLAPSDPVVDKFVYKSIEIVEASAKTTWGGRGWQPQMRWRDKDGQNQGSLHTPSWTVTQPLPVDLCFHSELRLEETDQTIPGSEIVVPAGQVTGFYFRPLKTESYQILKARADADGFVKTRLVLKPSRGVALSDPRIRRYFGGTITSDVVRVRVDRDEIGKEFEELPGKKP